MTQRVCLVGCGRWGSLICRDLVSLGVEVTVVAPTENPRRNAAEQGAHRVVDALADVGEVDGYVVAVPTDQHFAVVQQLLATNVPIFVEKPLTDELDQARELIDEAGERIFVMDKWRYHPGVLKLAELARSGELGDIQGIRSTRRQWATPHPDVDAVWILLPHDVSIALEVLGGVPPVETALGVADGDWFQNLVVKFGEPGTPWVVVDVGVGNDGFDRQIQVHGSQAVAVLSDGWAGSIQVLREITGSLEPQRETIPTPGELPLLAELRVFVEYLAGGPAPKSSGPEALLAIERIDEARRVAWENMGQ
ncbi:MAG: Gfo/Idh/MocA family protein [Candidatus Nanopelagicales bacterium]